jgi:hypothetical protein
MPSSKYVTGSRYTHTSIDAMHEASCGHCTLADDHNPPVLLGEAGKELHAVNDVDNRTTLS